MRESAIQNKQKCQELFWSGVDKIYGVEMQKNEVQSNACRENTITSSALFYSLYY